EAVAGRRAASSCTCREGGYRWRPPTWRRLPFDTRKPPESFDSNTRPHLAGVEVQDRYEPPEQFVSFGRRQRVRAGVRRAGSDRAYNDSCHKKRGRSSREKRASVSPARA